MNDAPPRVYELVSVRMERTHRRCPTCTHEYREDRLFWADGGETTMRTACDCTPAQKSSTGRPPCPITRE